MTARRIALAAVVAVLISSGAYTFIYLYRWEWNRAMFALLLFVATEVALATGVILKRLSMLEPRKPVDRRVLTRVQDAAPQPRRHFAWLDPSPDRMDVFVPVLMGAGIVLSALAWMVERLAAHTARPALEHGLTRRLSRLQLPDGGLVDTSPALDALFTPVPPAQ